MSNPRCQSPLLSTSVAFIATHCRGTVSQVSVLQPQQCLEDPMTGESDRQRNSRLDAYILLQLLDSLLP